MTPPVKPSIPSSHFRGISLNKKTKAAPHAVKSQVNVVAIRAASTGFSRANSFIFFIEILCKLVIPNFLS